MRRGGIWALMTLVGALAAAPAAQAQGGLTYVGCTAHDRGPASCSSRSALAPSGQIGLAPDGRHAYGFAARTEGQQQQALAIYSRDPAGGVLSYAGCVSDETFPVEGCPPTGPILPENFAFTPDGRTIYGSRSGTTLTSLGRDPGSGSLTAGACASERSFGPAPPCGPADALDGASSVEISPDGANVYVLSRRSEAIAMFSRDAATGSLSYLGCVKDTRSSAPCAEEARGLGSFGAGMEFTPDGRRLYVSGDPALLVFRRAASGTLSFEDCYDDELRGCIAEPFVRGRSGLALAPDGRSLLLGGSALVAVAPDSGGRLRLVGCVARVPTSHCSTAPEVEGLFAPVITDDGRSVYATAGFFESNDIRLLAFTRDPSTGALRYDGCARGARSVAACPVVHPTLGIGPAAAPGGRHVYLYDEPVADRVSGALTVLARPATGEAGAPEPPPSPTAARVAGGAASVSASGSVPLSVSCATGTFGRCRGTVTLKSGSATLARSDFAVREGSRVRVKVKLNARGRKLVRGRTVKAAVTIKTLRPDGRALTSRGSVRLRG